MSPVLAGRSLLSHLGSPSPSGTSHVTLEEVLSPAGATMTTTHLVCADIFGGLHEQGHYSTSLSCTRQ